MKLRIKTMLVSALTIAALAGCQNDAPPLLQIRMDIEAYRTIADAMSNDATPIARLPAGQRAYIDACLIKDGVLIYQIRLFDGKRAYLNLGDLGYDRSDAPADCVWKEPPPNLTLPISE